MTPRWWGRIRARWAATPTLILAALPAAIAIALVLPRLVLNSLWNDEAWVAIVVQRQAFDPRSLDTTPLGFAVLTAAVVHLGGSSDYWYRILPFLAGLGTILFTFFAATNIFGRRLEGFIAALLISMNLVAVTYSATLKPYSCDMCISVLVPYLVDRMTAGDRKRYWIVYGLTIVLGALLSFTALFIIAAGALTLLIAALRKGRGRFLVLWLIVHSTALLLLLFYSSEYLTTQHSRDLMAFWSYGFPRSFYPSTILSWYALQLSLLFVDFFTYSIGHADHGVAYISQILSSALDAVLVAAGCILIYCSRRILLFSILGPLWLATIAGLLHLFPFTGEGGGRVLLILLPRFAILLAVPIAYLLRLSRSRVTLAVSISVAAAVFSPEVVTSIAALQNPSLVTTHVEDARPLIINDLAPRIRSRDIVYVYWGGWPAFTIYGSRAGWVGLLHALYRPARVHGAAIFFGAEHDKSSGYLNDIAQRLRSGSYARLWLFSSHMLAQSTEHAVLARLSHCFGTEQALYAQGALLFRFELGSSPGMPTCLRQPTGTTRGAL